MTPGRWLVLTVRTPSDELVDELAGGLVALGGTAVEQDADRLTTYLPEPRDLDGFLATVTGRLAGIGGAEPELRWRWQDDEDWTRRWKEGLAPRRVGRRLVVTQPWNPVDPDGDSLVLVIDPATAFGTGEHATTRGSLRLMERVLAGGERVLDVGTGSGILAIAAALLGARRVLAVESDGDALGNAIENLDRAGVQDRVALVHAAVDAEYLAALRDRPLDLIVANVLSSVLVPLLPAFAGTIRPVGGWIVLGGILETEADEVLAAAAAAGLTAHAEDREDGWWTVLLCPARA